MLRQGNVQYLPTTLPQQLRLSAGCKLSCNTCKAENISCPGIFPYIFPGCHCYKENRSPALTEQSEIV